jgi:hypothetical protein
MMSTAELRAAIRRYQDATDGETTEATLRRFGIEPNALFDVVAEHSRDAEEAGVYEGDPFDTVFGGAFTAGFLYGWAVRGDLKREGPGPADPIPE